MEDQDSGFLEIEHSADWQLEVWGPDLLALFEQAGRGMSSLAGIRLQEGRRQVRSFEIEADDSESLLVGFLSEILFFVENERLGFDVFHLALDGGRLTARLEGAALAAIEKEIKAVTWHGLQIRPGERGLQAKVIFDV
jgi:SHS2 domain-containing protein